MNVSSILPATQISSIVSDIESFANSDLYSKCEVQRRNDGSLRIFIDGKNWDKGTIAEDLMDPDAKNEIVINASRQYDQNGGHFILIEIKRFYGDSVEKHTITINPIGKVKTSFSVDRKFEVLNGIDALKSAVRRLLELEMYKEHGMLANGDDAKAVLGKLRVQDDFDSSTDNPGKNSGNLTDEQWKDMEQQLGDISKILQMVE